jgi:hypothetical protein
MGDHGFEGARRTEQVTGHRASRAASQRPGFSGAGSRPSAHSAVRLRNPLSSAHVDAAARRGRMRSRCGCGRPLLDPTRSASMVSHDRSPSVAGRHDHQRPAADDGFPSGNPAQLG